ncbi:hypothetical protein BC829DRAFT_419372 [Chytridium lagenaria]|nr:hypothetical protein BC829DRAFT_419372 [Chytridium lagenaria]
MPPPSKQRKRTAKATECQRQNNLKRKELEEQLSESSSDSESDGEGEAGEKDDCYFESRPPLFGTSTPTAFRRLNTIRGTETLSDWIMVTESNRTATERRMQQQATIPSSSLASLRIPAVSGNLRQATLDKKKRIYRQGLKYTGAAERTRQRHQQLAKKEKAATGEGYRDTSKEICLLQVMSGLMIQWVPS